MAAVSINTQQLQDMMEQKQTFLVDFWAPWCPDCRRIEQAYDRIAEEYAGILTIVKLNVDENEGIRQEQHIRRIPTLRLYREGTPGAEIIEPESGAEIEAFLGDLLPGKKAEAHRQVYDMLIIGGGPGGYTAALYAARAGLETLVLEKLSAGGQMALTHQIDNYPGFPDGIGGWELAQQMQQQAEKFGAQTRNAQVRSLDLHANPKSVQTSAGTFYGKTVVLATGANPRELGLPQEKELTGRGVAYCAACDGMFYKDKTVVVVGGGNTAAADGLLLSRIAKKVIIVHRRDALRATKIYHQPLMQAENVEFCWNSIIKELLYEDQVTGVRVENVKTGKETILEAQGVFISIGRKPATELFAGQLPLDPDGYIPADETTQTGIPGVYAVGDVRTKQLRQVVTAVADGATAVHMAEQFLAQSSQG